MAWQRGTEYLCSGREDTNAAEGSSSLAHRADRGPGDLGEPLQCRGGSSGPVRWAGGGGGKGRADIRFHKGRVASSRASPSLSSMSLLEMTVKGPHCQPGRAGGAARMRFWLSPAGTLSPPSHLFFSGSFTYVKLWGFVFILPLRKISWSL